MIYIIIITGVIYIYTSLFITGVNELCYFFLEEFSFKLLKCHHFKGKGE